MSGFVDVTCYRLLRTSGVTPSKRRYKCNDAPVLGRVDLDTYNKVVNISIYADAAAQLELQIRDNRDASSELKHIPGGISI